MQKQDDLSQSEYGTIIGARWTGLSISETVDVLGFYHKIISREQPKKREYFQRKKSNSLGENALLMTEVKGEWPNRFKQKATASQLTTYHDQRYEV